MPEELEIQMQEEHGMPMEKEQAIPMQENPRILIKIGISSFCSKSLKNT